MKAWLQMAYVRAWLWVTERADSLFDATLAKDATAVMYAARHTLVSSHAAAGVPFEMIVDLAGHKSKKSNVTTFTCLHQGIPALVEAAQALEDRLDRVVEGVLREGRI